MTMPDHLDADGLHLDDPGLITTATGLRVNPTKLDETDIRIEDIARALAAQVRYNGHCHGHLSVARHCLWVAERVAPEHRLWALLHDAAEAYIGDLVRPLKHTAYGSNYLDHEAFIEEAVADKFGLPYPMPEAIRQADREVLAWELTHARWSYDGDAKRDEAEWIAAVCEAMGTACTLPTPKTEIIGLMGYAQSGKDTVAGFLDKFGYERVAFADALRGVLYGTDPIVGSYEDGEWPGFKDDQGDVRLRAIVDRHGWDRAKQEPEVRALLQRLGTEGARENIGQNVWIDAALRKVKPGGRYVFTDVRFPNEADAILAAGGTLWRIERPGVEAVNAHASETALDDYPVSLVLLNGGTLEDLALNVSMVIT